MQRPFLFMIRMHSMSVLNPPRRADLLNCAGRLLRIRAARRNHMPAGMFGEPAWDVVLRLFQLDGSEWLSVPELATSSGASTETMLRWLTFLEARDFVRFSEDGGGDEFVRLSRQGRTATDLCLHDILRSEIP